MSTYIWMSCKCPYCGDHISKTRTLEDHVSQVTQAIWSHLGTCDTTTNCEGLGPGLEPDEIKPFDEYPVLTEARMSKEGLLTFESILEESLVRCMESVMNSRVKWFESLVNDWGPDCTHARTGCQVQDHETGEWGPWVSTFNIPLLESIASGHFFDRSFAPVNENIVNVRSDNDRCVKLLDEWKSKFPANYKNTNLKIFKKGEGLTQEFLNRPRIAVLGPGRFERHPDLHPTAYKPTDPNDIRLILPAKGILPMGSAKGVVGYGMIHPNLINAAIENCCQNGWLQLESDEDLKAVKDGTQSLKTVLELKTATERDIFLWNYAGVLVQTGEWRRFHSLEELYVLLASFWGMKAPKVVPTCTTWSTFQDEGIRVQLDNHPQQKYYLSSLRRSISPSRRGPRSETSAPRTPIQTPKPPPTLEDLVAISDPTWNPDLHKGLDYLWAIMQVPVLPLTENPRP